MQQATSKSRVKPDKNKIIQLCTVFTILAFLTFLHLQLQQQRKEKQPRETKQKWKRNTTNMLY